jgi:hypothetical protein
MEELELYESLLTNRKPIYDDYAINPFQLERIVKEGKYKVHINQADERVFGPPIRRNNKGEIDEEITKLV